MATLVIPTVMLAIGDGATGAALQSGVPVSAWQNWQPKKGERLSYCRLIHSLGIGSTSVAEHVGPYAWEGASDERTG